MFNNLMMFKNTNKNKLNGIYKAMVNVTSMLSCLPPLVTNLVYYDCGDTKRSVMQTSTNYPSYTANEPVP
jgi:hypothetical protein